MSERRKHLTLEQGSDPNSPENMPAYLVIETRNTIQFRIGQMLTPKQVDDLKHGRIEYTVKPMRGR